MVRSRIRALAGWLPQGSPLSEADWTLRHRTILRVLIAHAVGVFFVGLFRAYTPVQSLLYAAPMAILAWLAARPGANRRLRACLATTGLLTASAVLVQMSHGLIEMHFHFFVMLFVITFYQDWLTFLLAAAYVAIDHGVVGVLAPRILYNHADAWHSPVKWAIVHASFIAGAGVAAITNWRLVERAETAQRELSDRLAYQASHDPLTGALNRREFERRVGDALAAWRDAATAPAAAPAAGGDGAADPPEPPEPPEPPDEVVCVIDLDRFKIVNDTCGHAAGDALLRQLTALIEAQVRRSDSVARLGGDEFGILLSRCPVPYALTRMEAVRAAIASYRFVWEQHTFMIGASIGVAAATRLTTSLDELLKSADAACYAAKDKGRDRVHLYQPDDVDLARQQGNSHWAGRILAALEQNRLELHYQPIAPIGAEASGAYGELLLRLRQNDGTLAYPGAFLPAAERYSLLPAIDRWVVSTALGRLGEAYRVGAVTAADTYTINLSGASIGDEKFLAFARGRVAESGLPPGVVCFEITETVAISNFDVAVQFVQELRTVGCRFALDDFGSGLSSFAYLKRLPVDFLKIDGSFVRGMLLDAIDRAMVESVNRIAHEMGLRTVAEFVETEAILDCLREVGVDYAQGYAIGRPGPLADHLGTLAPARAGLAVGSGG
jgi:diguanylate cyclase (GGDEF)-like protein